MSPNSCYTLTCPWQYTGSFRAERSEPDAKRQFTMGRMRYDAEFLYIAARIRRSRADVGQQPA